MYSITHSCLERQYVHFSKCFSENVSTHIGNNPTCRCVKVLKSFGNYTFEHLNFVLFGLEICILAKIRQNFAISDMSSDMLRLYVSENFRHPSDMSCDTYNSSQSGFAQQ